MYIYINGEYYQENEAKISVFDHGFLYGDGVFETLRTYQGRVFKEKEHLERLYTSAKMLELKIPPPSSEELSQAIKDTIRINELKEARVRVTISRGPGRIGLAPENCRKPTVVIVAEELPPYPPEIYSKGIEIQVVAVRRMPQSALNPRIKSSNCLNNILALIEATKSGASEAVMLNQFGYLTEGTTSNIFIVNDNILITPPPWIGLLKGITRDTVLELAEASGVKYLEEPISYRELFTASEVFITYTTGGIIPVARVNGCKVKGEIPGRITSQLMAAFKKLTEEGGN